MKHPLCLLLLLCLVNLRSFSQDILITHYAGATTFSRYEEFQPELTVQNVGIVPISTYFYAAFYLSTDGVWDASDKAIESVAFPSSLGAGQVSTSTPYRGAIGAAPGTYYLIIKADHDSRVTETDESNNTLVIPNFVITPPDVDFTFTSFSTDKTTYPLSSPVKLNYVLKNLGSTNAGGVIYIRLALSTDNVLDAYDYYFNDASEVLSGPDNFSSVNNTGLQPLALPAGYVGSYYILAKVDYDMAGREQFSETNEVNNLIAKPITIIPSTGVDLVVTGAYPGSADESSWTTTVYVTNVGTTSVAGYTIGAQLIPEGGTPDNYRYFAALGGLYDNTLAPGESKHHSGVMFSAFVPAGTYYAAYNINFDYGVSETEHSNNVFIDYAHPIVIPPRPVYSVLFNSFAAADVVDDSDQQLKLNLNLTNAGNVASYNQRYTVTIKDASNTVLHTQQATVLINFNPGQTATRTVTLNLASPLPVGSYQLSATCLSPVYTSPTSMISTLVVTPTLYSLTGTVKGEDGIPLTKGNLFLYQDDGSGIRFIQNITPYTGPTFSFSIDHHPHTLYFVPDPEVHPDYVPTIYGKTVVLQPESFFRTTTAINRDIEVLKLSSLPSGAGVIRGQVTSPAERPTGRRAAPVQPSALSLSSLPVVLLSATQQPVMITYTDAEGFYEFNNLPRDAYSILICFELDSHRMIPFAVDLTDKNMLVNFDISSGAVTPTSEQLYLTQGLTMDEFPSYHYGDAPIALLAQSTTDLPIEYSSSDTTIATIVNNEIQLHGVGTVLITARQPGNTFYLPASLDRSLTIHKADQLITMLAPDTLTYGNAPVVLDGTSTSALEVSFFSSDSLIASIESNVLTIHKPGTIELIARQDGSALYNPAASAGHFITIRKADQSLTVDAPASKVFGDVPFFLEGTSSAGLEVVFVSSDPTVASIAGKTVTIHAAGTVDIIAEQSGNEFYNPSLPERRPLFIGKSPQTISFAVPSEVTTDIGSFALSALSSSGLEVSFESSDDGVVSIVGNLATVHGEGVVELTAYQSGNQNFESAPVVTHALRVILVLSAETDIERQLYPNPTSGIVFHNTPDLRRVEVSDVMGRIYENLTFDASAIDLSGLESGVYFVRFIYDNRSSTARVFKR